MEKSIIFYHPTGNSNSRAVGEALHKSNMLESFHTTIATFPKNIFGKLSNLPGMGDFKRRSYNPDIELKTNLYPSKELGRIFASKLNIKSLIEKERGYFSIENVCKSLDKDISIYAKKNNIYTGIYAYEDNALASFIVGKQMGKFNYYDLPIGYWRAMHDILDVEKEKNPEWAITIEAFADSGEKLLRKDKELELADHIFVASTFTKETLKYYPKKLAPIQVVPYGFPTPNINRKYSKLGRRKLKVLFVGGLSQRKGISYLFEALKGMENYVELTVVGRGNLKGCKVLADELKKHNYIPSLSHTQILSLMADSDVFVFPSLFEGFGMVITEAMSQGTPVITTERTCGPDVISDGENGWIVAAGHSFAIKERLELILENQRLCEEVGRKATQTAFSRDWQDYGEDTVDFIKNQ